jgi:hypothetical protein
MILKLTIFNWRFTFSCAPITKVIGVNSILPNGNHILMWDFDETTLNKVVSTLLTVQRTYDLPTIYILETKPPMNTITYGTTKNGKRGAELGFKLGNYIAYCFKEVPWRKAIEIITYTEGVDYNFIKYGIFRNKFTLRVSPKCGRKPKLVYKLYSDKPEEVSIRNLKDWVQYETLSDGFKQQKVEVRIGEERET